MGRVAQQKWRLREGSQSDAMQLLEVHTTPRVTFIDGVVRTHEKCAAAQGWLESVAKVKVIDLG